MEKKLIGKECKFVYHLKRETGVRPDTHIVKEVSVYDDGSTEDNLKIINNFKRPFYITKENYQNHKDKKESEKINRVNEYSSTESNLLFEVGKRLGGYYATTKNKRIVKDSPYVYGLDIKSSTHIKNIYMTKYDNIVTKYDVVALDIEVNTAIDEIIVLSIASGNKIYTVINKSLLNIKTTSEKNLEKLNKEFKPKLKYLYDKYIPNHEIKKIDVTYEIVEDELDVVKKAFAMLHKWKPDIVSIWNIMYDIGKILNVLEKYDVKPKDIFCEPSLPDNLKSFYLKIGQMAKKTASGKHSPIDREMQWHQILAPANFWWVDAMSAHRYVRVGGKSVPGGYSLDNILKYELGDKLGKLHFTDGTSEYLKGLEWHIYMVENRPLEYIIYNQWDVMSMIILDQKTNDLESVMPMLSGVSSFEIFNSGPKRIIDAMNFFYLEKGIVLGTKPNKVEDANLLGLSDWITLVPSYRVKETTGKALYPGSKLLTNARLYSGDADQTSGYPNDGIVGNVSKDTTVNELATIENIPLETFMLQNIDMLFGPVNSLEYSSTMLNLPTVYEVEDELKKIKSGMM